MVKIIVAVPSVPITEEQTKDLIEQIKFQTSCNGEKQYPIVTSFPITVTTVEGE